MSFGSNPFGSGAGNENPFGAAAKDESADAPTPPESKITFGGFGGGGSFGVGKS